MGGRKDGKMYKTTDGGESWIPQESTAGATYYSTDIHRSKERIAAGDYNIHYQNYKRQVDQLVLVTSGSSGNFANSATYLSAKQT
ncbi:MAG: hypothetical protein IPI04_18175 [Ignavibacteria bacterium]|nr:hypothetical protein [Ignavibacteria bacterium]